jgi:MFS family permease
MTRDGERVTFRSVLGVREFRAMWTAELLSIAGDQLARVALSVVVFQWTASAFLTGLTYALTFVPALVGGILLSSLGDRYPRRDVMVVADLVRAVLVGFMAVPGVPLWSLCTLVAVVTLLNGPFKAAQQALLPDVLSDSKYTLGMAIRNITNQSAQLLGFAGGGAVVSAINPSVGLALNAATFLLSAVVLRRGVGHRPAATGRAASSGRMPFLASTTAGARVVWRDPALRVLLALCWLAGFYITPEALAAPYADSLETGALGVGLIMASDPLGSVIGGIVFGRWVPEHQQVRVIGVLGILAGVPLVFCVLQPGLVTSMALFAISGALATAYTIQGTASYTRKLPDAQRAQGSGLLSSGLITIQGLGALAAGVVADLVGPAHAIALAGLTGAIVAVPVAVGWRRAKRSAIERSR